MPNVVNQGCKIYWTEAGSGPPVLLIMGLSLTHEMWYRIMPAVTREHRAILFDNRGVGRSDVPRAPYSIPQMASDAAAVLEAAGETSAHVVGASMGGMIAQELALTRPHLVRSLVLGCTTHGGLLARWPRALPALQCGYNVLCSKSEEERERSARSFLYARNTPQERVQEDTRVRCSANWNKTGGLYQLAGILRWSSYLRLPRIQVPTIVLHGDEDQLIPIQNGRVVASRIPGAEFHPIPGAGHMLTTDQLDLCLEHLTPFLEQQRTSQHFSVPMASDTEQVSARTA